MYAINFTQPFQTSQNASLLLQRVNKTAGAANNLAPNYIDGTIFSNDNELLFYGGLLLHTDSLQLPPATRVMSYERFQYGPYRESWETGFIEGTLPNGVSRYITSGAGVNVPSENLGFYFGGLRRPDWGEIREGGNTIYNATAVANTLISVDMSTMREEKWANESLPSSVPGRANAELVWIPTADQGLLIAIGGVINPEWVFLEPLEDLTRQSVSCASIPYLYCLTSLIPCSQRNTSPGFMSNVSVYDIKSKKW